MKTPFKDAEDFVIDVMSDWRGGDGKAKDYTPKNKTIYLSGGVGLYWYLQGEFMKAIQSFTDELETVLVIEQKEKIRLHKGLYYYQLAKCYEFLGDKKTSKNWLKKAVKEDRLSYGKKSKQFPASK